MGGGGVTAFGSGFLTTGLDFGVLLAPKMFANGDEASFLGAGGFTTGAAFLTTGAAFLTTGAALTGAENRNRIMISTILSYVRYQRR